ncbi:unnamed protein product [Cyprideis torosa]|uniref:Uncharacterized protein n=1 Tax=Cyprideis torosa TaxID=163714 RepID=A0A7R8ZJL2_9CRUS|nr:unnamed protein product [Cyprideis torosa]CAG0888900.1 unnamed protein product [Cyprideis torosa]
MYPEPYFQRKFYFQHSLGENTGGVTACLRHGLRLSGSKRIDWKAGPSEQIEHGDDRDETVARDDNEAEADHHYMAQTQTGVIDASWGGLK